eukprot:gnl/TRDRNA2_/TRDRNA2_47529_c0_seq1.p1 gnl/TRDRNA2_/TRDRNA2_47529_c0~~gnl/TRDRNA2_/TRDRNA2_47529_c0_seq1.p1  ORF type:complete len:626 (+),score=119.51 gnl/TRDRNA2_/TRDRNA2_47529_c0_seq1:97-1974(+)
MIRSTQDSYIPLGEQLHDEEVGGGGRCGGKVLTLSSLMLGMLVGLLVSTTSSIIGGTTEVQELAIGMPPPAARYVQSSVPRYVQPPRASQNLPMSKAWHFMQPRTFESPSQSMRRWAEAESTDAAEPNATAETVTSAPAPATTEEDTSSRRNAVVGGLAAALLGGGVVLTKKDDSGAPPAPAPPKAPKQAKSSDVDFGSYMQPASAPKPASAPAPKPAGSASSGAFKAELPPTAAPKNILQSAASPAPAPKPKSAEGPKPAPAPAVASGPFKSEFSTVDASKQEVTSNSGKVLMATPAPRKAKDPFALPIKAPPAPSPSAPSAPKVAGKAPAVDLRGPATLVAGLAAYGAFVGAARGSLNKAYEEKAQVQKVKSPARRNFIVGGGLTVAGYGGLAGIVALETNGVLKGPEGLTVSAPTLPKIDLPALPPAPPSPPPASKPAPAPAPKPAPASTLRVPTPAPKPAPAPAPLVQKPKSEGRATVKAPAAPPAAPAPAPPKAAPAAPATPAGPVKLPSGIVSNDIVVGSGSAFNVGDVAFADVVAKVGDKVVFDTAGKKIPITLGNAVSKTSPITRDVSRAILDMRSGGQRVLEVPKKISFNNQPVTYDIKLSSYEAPVTTPPPKKKR